MENASKSVDSNRSVVEFNASEEGILKNIDIKNNVIKGFATASAQGGTPIKMKVKGYRKYIETGNTAKTIEFDLDLSTDNIEEIKGILKELKE